MPASLRVIAPLAGVLLFGCVADPGVDPDPGPDPSPALLIKLGDAKPAPIQLGAATVGGSSPAMVVAVINSRTTASGVLHVSVTGADASQFDLTDLFSNCEGVRLAPQAQCSLRVRLRPTSIGAKVANLVIDDGGATTISLRGTGVASVLAVNPAAVEFGTVDVGATATRTITVSNLGTRALGGLAATATGAAYSVAASTCGTLAPGASCTVTARFAPTAAGDAAGAVQIAGDGESASSALHGTGRLPGPSLTLVAGGAAMGEIRYHTSTAMGTCTSTCVVAVTPGESVSLHALTPSRFGAWSGACTGADPDCTVTVSAPLTVTARFDGDPGEQWSRRPAGVFDAAAFDAAGGLFVASGSVLQKLDETGAPMWTAQLGGGSVAGLDTDAAGNAFVALQQGSAVSIRAFSPTGGALWATSIAGAAAPIPEAFPHALAVTSTGDVAILARSGGTGLVRVYRGSGAGAGTERWSAPGLPMPVYTIAADGAGNVLAAVGSIEVPALTQVMSFDSAGVGSTLVDPLPGNYDAAIAVDADDAVVSSVSGHSSLTVARIGGFEVREEVNHAANVPHGVDVDGARNVVSTYWRDEWVVPGIIIERFAPSGAITYRLEKGPDPFDDIIGIEPHALAVAADGRIVVAGLWNQAPWIALYRP
jgi:hypothetical protein